MKLLTKTSLYYLIFSIPVLVIASYVAYYLITKELKENTDELLWQRKIQIEQSNYTQDSTYIHLLNNSGEIILTKTNKPLTNSFFYNDTLIFDTIENENAPYRMLNSFIQLNNQTFHLQITRSTVEYEDLLFGVLTSMLLILIFLLAAFFIVNYFISKYLWHPFTSTLATLNNFEISKTTNMVFQKSSTKEFKLLNSTLKSMMQKMLVDYTNQKQFTENASHEIQTPLAVIRAQIDMLIQSEKLGDFEMKIISSIIESTTKLSNLNKSLLLLSKIENSQFLNEDVLLNSIIKNAINQFSELIESKNIKIITRYYDTVTLNIHPHLCEILIVNLLQNAIKHNLENGIISIELNNHNLLISNSGNPLTINTSAIFNRFVKHGTSENSTGLGLAIVKEICNTSHITITYFYKDNLHCFKLIF